MQPGLGVEAENCGRELAVSAGGDEHARQFAQRPPVFRCEEVERIGAEPRHRLLVERGDLGQVGPLLDRRLQLRALGLADRATVVRMQALEQLRLDLERTAMHPLWRPLPAGHVWNLTALNSGPPGPAVPDGCELQYNIGAIGGERLADLRSAVEAVIALVTAEDAWLAAHPPELRWVGLAMDPALTDPEHPAVRAFVAAGRELGEPAAVTGLSAITDGRHLVNSGGIPTINFGPGEIHRCHSPEEALPLEELRRATTWVAAFTARYCGVAPESRA